MPIITNHPGVYVQEIPSGVRTITGVPTSITAFVGRASQGPADQQTLITSYSDFEHNFGGLDANYPMSYAVRDFYNNGGSEAVIVRRYKAAAAGDDGAAKIDLTAFKLEAAGPGTFGNKLQATVNKTGVTDAIAKQYGLTAADLFNLIIQYDPTNNGPQETFLNLSVADGPRRIDKVLLSSSYVRVPLKADGTPDLPNPPVVPGAATYAATAGSGKDSALLTVDVDYLGDQGAKTGMYALDRADIFNMLCFPPDTFGGDVPTTVYTSAMDYCQAHRAFLLVDAPVAWASNLTTFLSNAATDLGNFASSNGNYAAIYFPSVLEPDPQYQGRVGTFPVSGMMAGIFARTDQNRGVWKAPAGTEATLGGAVGLQINLTDEEQDVLNPLGINCLRSFPIIGRVVWGARTLRGADQLADEYKYVPVRRTALYIEESLRRGLQWAVFEPNDDPLWAQIRLNVGAFMHNLFVKGAFQGKTPRDAYFVKCDSETTTQNDIDLGIVNVIVGFAPLKPAEFVIISLQQIAGQLQV
ncbi:MAG TPA: phage tail sheath subtilisin-like domain-containing protein [Ktedonobacteraceae bacterium]|nr:phage tail sheath subtilisin-like domain-containing protein [Ktedonobacteraceae bacterium]